MGGCKLQAEIDEINYLLKEYESFIATINPLDTPYTLIISSYNLIERILRIYAKNRDYDEEESIRNLFKDINFPNEGEKIFHKLSLDRVNSVNDPSSSLSSINSFLINYKQFLQWFNNYYSEEHSIKKTIQNRKHH